MITNKDIQKIDSYFEKKYVTKEDLKNELQVNTSQILSEVFTFVAEVRDEIIKEIKDQKKRVGKIEIEQRGNRVMIGDLETQMQHAESTFHDH